MCRDMLTAKQLKFCALYATSRNGADAYAGSFNPSKATKRENLSRNAAKLLADPEIALEVERITEAAAREPGGAVYDAAWCRARWAQIAQADARELIGLRIGCCRYCHGVNHGYQWKQREYLEALAEAERKARKDPDAPMPDMGGGWGFNQTKPPNPDCPECHGEGLERFVARDTNNLSPSALLLYGGVKVKRDGYEIIIADRTKALENVTRMAGGYKDNVRLDGSLETMSRVVKMEAVDAKEAARMYQELMASPAVRAT